MSSRRSCSNAAPIPTPRSRDGPRCIRSRGRAGGGDVNDVNKDGETALHGAVYRGGAVSVIQFLADKGAKLDVENKKKWTPLLAAEGVVYASSGVRRYPDAAALLRKLMREKGL